MLKERFKNKEEALKVAQEYLTEDKAEYEVIQSTVFVSSSDNKDEELFTIVKLKGSTSFALICKLSFQTEWTLKAYKNVVYTYPFRGVEDKGLFVLCALNALFCKPLKALSPAEALTPEGAKEVYSFFGVDLKKMVRRELLRLECGNSLTVERLSYLVEDVISNRLKDADSYIETVSNIYGVDFDEEQKSQVLESYEYTKSEYFLRYALYEFLRTEDYNHLKEVLSYYGTFGLRDDWGKRHFPLSESFGGRETAAEEYIISRYLSNDAREKVGVQSYRELAELTGIPLGLIYKALKSRDIWY